MERFGVISLLGVMGSLVTNLTGGWTEAMTTLCIFMLIDYITGLLTAGLFKKSPNTKDGCIESKAGWKGLARKFATLLLVLVACRLDLVLGVNYIKDCVIIAFIANEVISITENIGLMGVPLPKVITSTISILNEKGGETDDEQTDSDSIEQDRD